MDKAKDHHGMVGSEFPKEKHSSRPSSVMSNNSSKTHDVSILVHNVIISTTYNASQKHESTLLHTYVPKDFLTVLVQQNVFEKTLRELVANIFTLFWHLLSPNWSMIPAIVNEIFLRKLFFNTHCASNN